LRNLERAYKDWRAGKKGKPKFKKKGVADSFYLEGSIRIAGDRIKVPVLGWLKCAEILPAVTPKNVTISCRCGAQRSNVGCNPLLAQLFKPLAKLFLLYKCRVIIRPAQHCIVKSDVFPLMPVDTRVNEAWVLIALEFVHRIVHKGTVEHPEADQ